MLVGLFLGVGIPVGIILLLDMLNDKVRSIDEVKRALPFPVLGDIPELPQEEVTLLREKFFRVGIDASDTGEIELYAGRESLSRIVGDFRGTRRGKTLVAAHLAKAYARAGKRRYWLVVICEIRSYTRIFIRITPWLVGLSGRNGTGMETAGTFARKKI